MKKFLSVVLALAMTFSLVVVGASAKDFTDKDKVTKTEAVGVMSGMGIISGYTDGSFKPQGNITRGAAAKIICIASLGTKTAGVLTCDTAPFKDVAKDSTFAPYISYCVNTGIIDGYSDGSFQPSKNVSGFAFAKMLLNALKIKGTYTGANWSVNVAQAAIKANLFNGIEDSVSYSNPATRENACQMTFNALNYTAAGTSSKYVVKASNADNAAILYSGTDALTALVIKQANDGSVMTLVNTNEGSLGATLFGLTKGTTTDDFGRVSTVYTNGKDGTDKVTYATFAPKAVLTYTAPVTAGKIFSDLGLKNATDNVAVAKVTVKVDNGAGTSYGFSKGDTTHTYGTAGASVEVYKTGADTYTVIVVNTYVKVLAAGDIVKAKAATTNADAVAAYIKLEGTPTAPTAAGAYATDAYKAGDVVLYTKTGTGDTLKIQSVEKATVVTGKLQKYTATTMTVGGVTYTKAKSADASVDGSTVGFTADKAFYVDKNNNVYYVGTVDSVTSTADGYFYVLGTQIQYTAGNDTDLINGATTKSAVVKAKVVALDGTVSIVNLKVITENKNLYYYDQTGTKQQITAAAAYAEENVWAGYTVENGTYTILPAANYAANAKSVDSVTLNKTPTAVDSKYVTSATNLTVINTADGTVKKTTGVANMTLDSATVLSVYASSTATTVDNLYVVKTTTETVTDTATYAYAATQGAVVSNGTEWTFYVNGAAKTYPVSLTRSEEYTVTSLTAGKVYDLHIVDGVITGAKSETNVAGAIPVKVTVADKGFFVAGSVYSYATTGCAVYNVTTGTPGTADSIEVGDYVVVVAGGTSATSLVYIVDAPAN